MSLTKVTFSMIAGAMVNSIDYPTIQDAIDAATAQSKTLFVPDGDHLTTGLTVTCPMVMSPGAIFKYTGAQNGVLLDIQTDNTYMPFIHTDANSIDCTQVKISGDNNVIDTVIVDNGVASSTSSTAIYGVAFYGAENKVHNIHVNNFANTGQANMSFPQAVFFYGSGNIAEAITAKTCASCVAIGSLSDNTRIGSLDIEDAADNGIYQLGGNMSVGRVRYANGEEPIVFAGGNANIDVIEIIGNAVGIGIQDCGNVNIGQLIIEPDSVGDSAKFIVRTRAGSIACGNLSIDSIVGTLKGTSLFYLTEGTVENITVGNMDAMYYYDATLGGTLGNWFNFDACVSFNLGDVACKIIDVNNVLVGTDYFSFKASNTSKISYLHSMNVVVFESDETTYSAGGFRAANLIQPHVYVYSGQFQTNVGPYLLRNDETAFTNGIYVNAAPSTGTWRAGSVVWNYAPSAGGTPGWVCVTAGTPGTWKAMANVAA